MMDRLRSLKEYILPRKDIPQPVERPATPELTDEQKAYQAAFTILNEAANSFNTDDSEASRATFNEQVEIERAINVLQRAWRAPDQSTRPLSNEITDALTLAHDIGKRKETAQNPSEQNA